MIETACDVRGGVSSTVVYINQLFAMARVKNTVRASNPEDTKLPRAVFDEEEHVSGKKTVSEEYVGGKKTVSEHVSGKKTVGEENVCGKKTVSEKKASCPVCGKIVLKSNLARHKKRHVRGRWVRDESPPGSPTPSILLDASPRDHLRLKIRLPAVARVLREKEVESLSVGDRRLPTTPSSEEEFNRELAKLYASRVVEPSSLSFSYLETRCLLSCARDVSRREALKQVFASVGLELLSKEELAKKEEDALERGRLQMSQEPVPSVPCPSADVCVPVAEEASLPTQASVPRDEPESSVAPPLLRMTTEFQEGAPQVFNFQSGGSWGIRVMPYRVQQ